MFAVKSANPPKQIAAYTTAGGTALYTVPVGRTFTGSIYVGSGCFFSIVSNGVTAQSPTSPTASLTIFPVTLIAGSAVVATSATNGLTVMGVES